MRYAHSFHTAHQQKRYFFENIETQQQNPYYW